MGCFAHLGLAALDILEAGIEPNLRAENTASPEPNVKIHVYLIS